MDWFLSSPLFLVGTFGAFIALGALTVAFLNYRRQVADGQRTDWNERLAEWHKLMDALVASSRFWSAARNGYLEFEWPQAHKTVHAVEMLPTPEQFLNQEKIQIAQKAFEWIEVAYELVGMRRDGVWPDDVTEKAYEEHLASARRMMDLLLRWTEDLARAAPNRLPYKKALTERIDTCRRMLDLRYKRNLTERMDSLLGRR